MVDPLHQTVIPVLARVTLEEGKRLEDELQWSAKRRSEERWSIRETMRGSRSRSMGRSCDGDPDEIDGRGRSR